MKKIILYNKFLLTMIFTFFIINVCKSQIKPNKDIIENFDHYYHIRIEVNQCNHHIIKLFEEGMICNSIGTIEFFPFVELNTKKYYELKSYIAKDIFFSKDTIIDDPIHRIFTNPYGFTIEITILNNDKLIKINWIDGKCKELEKCIDMINDLIPKEKRNKLMIDYKQIIP